MLFQNQNLGVIVRSLVFALGTLFCTNASAQTNGSAWPPAYAASSYDYAVSCFAAASLAKFYADQGVVPMGTLVEEHQTLLNSYLSDFRPILNDRARREGKTDQAVQADVMAAMGNWDRVRNYTNWAGQVTTGSLAGYFSRLEYLMVCGRRIRGR
jgi:hypothetical protein